MVLFNRLIALMLLLIAGPVRPAMAASGSEPRWEMWHPPPATPTMAQMDQFHFMLLIIMIGVCTLVVGLIAYVAWRFNEVRNPVPSRVTHNTLIEVIWTVVPVLILLVIAVPSFRLLYFADRVEDPELTLQVTGYQWYWGYQYPDQQIAEFASYIVPEGDLQPGQPRLLATDTAVVLPVDTDIQILVTGGDVIHSWGIAPFGVKVDAVPGRMHETWVRIEEEGTYYGHCYEICGTGHSQMPIMIRAVSRQAFDDWVIQQTAGLDLEQPPVLLTRKWEDASDSRSLAQN